MSFALVAGKESFEVRARETDPVVFAFIVLSG